MLDRAFVAGVALTLAVPALAQQTAAPAPQAAAASAPQAAAAPAPQAATATPAAPDDPAKPLVETFEMVLRSAVDRGGQKFAQHASSIWPSIEWEPGGAPVVNGVVVRDLGIYVFQVQVPGLNQTTVQVARLFNQFPRREAKPATEAVANGGTRVGADGGTVAPDPMTTSPAPGVPTDFDPNRAYSDDVKAELVDALIDRSGVLPIGPSESIVVVAGGDDSGVMLLYRSNARKLVLSVKGSDLADFRAGKITRDEIKQRIKEEHF